MQAGDRITDRQIKQKNLQNSHEGCKCAEAITNIWWQMMFSTADKNTSNEMTVTGPQMNI